MEKKIEILKNNLSKISTRDLLGYIANKFISIGNDVEEITNSTDIFNKTDLMSPYKQYSYLAGLLMSTDDNSNNNIIRSKNKYTEIEKKVQQITGQYINNFFDINNIEDIGDGINFKKNIISMNAFTSYFDMDILRYEEQTEELIRNLYIPFNKEIEEKTQLEIEDYISFYHFVLEKFKNSLDKPNKSIEKVKDFLNSFKPGSNNIEEEYKRLLSGENGALAYDLQTSLDSVYTIEKSDILNQFGMPKGQKFLEYFTLKRQKRNFIYYNTKNPFAIRPLCWIDKDTLFVVHPKFLITSIYNFITELLEDPRNKFIDKYKEKKADIVEELFLKNLKKVFGDNAKYYKSVCEERGTKEHDILIEFKNNIFIIEVKASKVREPFFNPEKAFVRIRDHFNSDSGIGGAFIQASNLKDFIFNTHKITLYKNKVEAFTLENVSKKNIYLMILTLNQFGSIAINTSNLLQKEENDNYPWVCNLHDLDDIIEIMEYLNKDTEDFIEYIDWRIEKHASILASDELDIFEQFCINPIKLKTNKNDKLLFWPSGPSIIDKIYFEKHGIPYAHPALDNFNSTIIKEEKENRSK